MRVKPKRLSNPGSDFDQQQNQSKEFEAFPEKQQQKSSNVFKSYLKKKTSRGRSYDKLDAELTSSMTSNDPQSMAQVHRNSIASVSDDGQVNENSRLI